jgi:predicted ATPase with chaperone activity
MNPTQLLDEAAVDESFTPPAPQAPKNAEETGLSQAFLADLILKVLFNRGSMSGYEIAREVALPFNIIEDSLNFLREVKSIEIARGDMIGAVSYQFNLTDLGRQRARDAMETLAYFGPAPVPLATYVEQCYKQKVTGIPITPNGLKQAFSHMVITDELIHTVGPAIVSGKAVFIYGPPGTGKTAIAQAIGEYMNHSGGEVYVPYAIMAEDGVVTVYDPIVHQRVDVQQEDVGPKQVALVEQLFGGGPDERWIKIRRPVIITGGELTLDMLDLRYGASRNVYQAPLHIKSNGGIFLIDDFGRQLVSPKELLNRWIFPLESRHDFMTLASGKKFMVPFEQLIIFSTNLDPKELVDDAFLRRIRHKIGISAPDRALYEKIFNLFCRRLSLNPCPEAIDYLFERYYNRGRISRPSDCRDLLEIVVSICRFRREKPHLTRELIVEASRQFISEF